MTDLIESLLERVSLRTRVFHRGRHCGNWKLNLEHLDKVLLQFVSEESCVVKLPEQQYNNELFQGDLLLFPRPTKHVLRASDQTGGEIEKQTCTSREMHNSDTS